MPASTQGALLDGRYRVIRQLGSGGMASVLLARDERLDRLVAVKRLHADSPADVERRFAREAKLGASLNHPNLVSVFDTAIDDEGVLIIMEYVPGEALSPALRRGPLAPGSVATIAREVGLALDHAHGHGVVHRDVKPGNVLLRDDGTTKLADLGIATAADATRITRSGTVLGTAAYMAPEQLEGVEAGAPADVYALAAVCFEALSGARPRSGRTPVELAHAISTQPPPDLGEHWREAPVAATELLRRGMSRDPRERPGSAGELGSGLARALEEEPSTAATRALAPAPRTTRRPPPPPPSRRLPPPPPSGPARHAGAPNGPSRRSGSRAAWLALLVLALAVGGIAFALVSGGDGGGSEQSADAPRDRGTAGNGERERQPQEAAEPSEQAPAPEPEPEPEPEPAPAPPPETDSEPEPEPPAADEAPDGAELNAQGFELMNGGRYAEAVPILQQAVSAFPPGSADLEYAYALFNLGKSLRLADRPAEAVPVLEQRLAIPNQTGAVRRELELARQAAGGG